MLGTQLGLKEPVMLGNSRGPPNIFLSQGLPDGSAILGR